jgi:hypothetical protein
LYKESLISTEFERFVSVAGVAGKKVASKGVADKGIANKGITNKGV